MYTPESGWGATERPEPVDLEAISNSTSKLGPHTVNDLLTLFEREKLFQLTVLPKQYPREPDPERIKQFGAAPQRKYPGTSNSFGRLYFTWMRDHGAPVSIVAMETAKDRPLWTPTHGTDIPRHAVGPKYGLYTKLPIVDLMNFKKRTPANLIKRAAWQYCSRDWNSSNPFEDQEAREIIAAGLEEGTMEVFELGVALRHVAGWVIRRGIDSPQTSQAATDYNQVVEERFKDVTNRVPGPEQYAGLVALGITHELQSVPKQERDNLMNAWGLTGNPLPP